MRKNVKKLMALVTKRIKDLRFPSGEIPSAWSSHIFLVATRFKVFWRE